MFVHVLVLRVLLLHWTTQRGLTSLFEALLKSVTKLNVTKLYRKGTVRLISFHDKRPTRYLFYVFIFLFSFICVAQYANMFGYAYVSFGVVVLTA